MGQGDGKVAIVTGAAGGMGAAIVGAFADAGAAVVAADVNEEGLAATVGEVARAGGRATAVRTDVSRSEDVRALVDRAVSEYGGLDWAVNAAAIEFESARLADCSEDDFDRMIAVNLRSIFLCMKYEIGAMADRGGSIVNLASTNSFRPQHNQPAYTAAKHGVLGLTRAAAMDYAADGIRINAICPGAIDTPMLRTAMARRGGDPEDTARRLSPLARFGRPEEIAAAALWLCSDASSFVVGHPLLVDGGYLAT